MRSPIAHEAAGMTETPLMDWERLRMVAATAQEQSVLLLLFFRLAEEAVAALAEAAGQGNVHRWTSAAHDLRGSSGNLGMTALEELCSRAEREGIAAGEHDDMPAQIRTELARLRAHVAGRGIPLPEA